MRKCLKCKKELAKDVTKCPSCGTEYNPAVEKLGYISFAIVVILFVVPDAKFWMDHGRLPASIDEFFQAFSSLF